MNLRVKKVMLQTCILSEEDEPPKAQMANKNKQANEVCKYSLFSGGRYFRRESLFQELKSPSPLPTLVEFRLADWPKKYFSGQSAGRSSRATLSISYAK